jgi:hypothetical protein
MSRSSRPAQLHLRGSRVPEVANAYNRGEILLYSPLCSVLSLARRARDVTDILLVKVTDVHPALKMFGSVQYQIADYELLEILKGKLDRPLKNVGHALTISYSRDDPPIPNPALKLLHPGSQLLMFSDSSTDVDSPCETVAATESAKQAIQIALRSHAFQSPDGDLAR